MTLSEILSEKSCLFDKGITFIKSQRQEFLSYSELYLRASQVLYSLKELNIRPKDELILQVEDDKYFLFIFWACILGGIIPIPVSLSKNDNHRSKIYEIWKSLDNPYIVVSRENLLKLQNFSISNNLLVEQQRIEDKSIFIEEILSSKKEGETYPSSEGDIAFIQFSSGSTGSPKGVVLTHHNLLSNIQAISEAAGYTDNDSMINWMPLTHDMGLIGFHINPLFMGINQIQISTDQFIRRPAVWLDKASEYKTTILCSPNFGYRYLLNVIAHDERAWDLSNVRIIYNGAEPISTRLCNDFTKQFSQFGLRKSAICPVYGLAEASVAVSISNVSDHLKSIKVDRFHLEIGDTIKKVNQSDDGISFVNVGKPIKYCRVKITNSKNAKVAEKVVGRIAIKGENVAKSYYNNKAASNATMKSSGWVYTGDLGFISEGCLYVTGREKDIIFVNGQNYYSHDLEKEAQEIKDIHLNKVVVAGYFNDRSGQEEVLAFLIFRKSLEKFVPLVEKLKSLVNLKYGFELSHVLPVNKIPKTTSGKLQRFELVKSYQEGKFDTIKNKIADLLKSSESKTGYKLPKNLIEKKIIKIWAKVLKANKLGINQNFFEIGGNSLKAGEVVSHISKELKVELPLSAVQKNPTIETLALEVSQLEKKELQSIPKSHKSGYHPVSSSQRRMYLTYLIDVDSTAYNIPLVFRISGKIDLVRLESCIRKLIARHDSLRMTFGMYDGNEPKLIIHENFLFNLKQITTEEEELNSVLKSLVKPFDLSVGPLIRASYLISSNGEHYLFFDFHHIIYDGHSIQLFFEELMKLYNHIQLDSLAISFKDFVNWEKSKKPLMPSEEYWKTVFSGRWPVLDLPSDFPRPATLATIGKSLQFGFEKDTTKELRLLSQSYDVTFHTLMLTLYHVFLTKITGQSDIVVGIPVSGRLHPDLLEVQGMLVNNLAIRCNFSSNISFGQALKKTDETMSMALEHQDYPFEELIKLNNDIKNPSRNPVFDTMFLYNSFKVSGVEDSEIEFSRHHLETNSSKYDLTLEVNDENGAIRCSFEYSSMLFLDETIQSFCDSFATLVEEVLKDPDKKISGISMLTKREREKLTLDSSDFDTGFDTINKLFEDQVRKTPHSIAIQEGDLEWSYSDLNTKANQLASALINRGLKPNEPVALLIPNSTDTIVGILGILKAGGCYLPIDTSLAKKRIKYLIEDSSSKIILTNNHHLTELCDDTKHLGLDIHKLLDEDLHDAIYSDRSTSKDLAYVMYTSGTSGGPKGVMVTHDSVVNYIQWADKRYVRGTKVTFPFYSSISFDLTVTSIFTPLISGNKIIVYKKKNDKLTIEQVVRDNQVDIIKLTPSHLKLILENNIIPKHFSVQKFIIGGEQLSSQLAHELYKCMEGDVEIYNEYGPTEATVGCMIYQYQPSDPYSNVPIGVTIDNTCAHILDNELNPVPTAAIGDLFLSGRCLAKGYLFNEDLSSQKFIESPLGNGVKLYKTGDKARRLPSGNLSYIGRKDSQIKMSGYRIELTEIEHQLSQHETINQVSVLEHKGENDQSILCAYYTINDSGKVPLDETVLKKYLADVLPFYMIPAHFIKLDTIPLTNNGKLDAERLRLFDIHQEKNREQIFTTTSLEKQTIEVWENVLGESGIGLDDNFFELGGDSIKAVQISTRLFDKGIEVEVKHILTYHTIRQLSEFTSFVSYEAPIDQGLVSGILELNTIQRWFFSNNFSNPNYYNQSVFLELKIVPDVSLLEKTFAILIDTHDGLRLNYDSGQGKLFYNENHLGYPFKIKEHSIDTGSWIDSNVFEICSGMKSKFQIESGLLIGAVLIHRTGDSSRLLISAHHLVIDGVSWRILLNDLESIYEAFQNGQRIKNLRKTTSLKVWEEQLDAYAKSEVCNEGEEYWERVDRTKFAVPLDTETDDWRYSNRGRIVQLLDERYTTTLIKKARTVYNVDVPVLLDLSILQALKYWMDEETFILEKESHGRNIGDCDTSRTIGWFTSMYPVLFNLTSIDIGDQIKAIKEQLADVPNGGFSFGIKKFIQNRAEVIQPNISQVRVNYLGDFTDAFTNKLFSFNNEYSGEDVDPSNQMTAVLEIEAMIIEGSFQFTYYFNKKAHKKETINKLAYQTRSNLEIILDHIQEEDTVHFTPSDFSAKGLDKYDLDTLFG